MLFEICLFNLSHFISQIRPRDLFRLLAIGMCPFLPVYHLGIACLPKPKVKIQHKLVRIWASLSESLHEIPCIKMRHLNRFGDNSSSLNFSHSLFTTPLNEMKSSSFFLLDLNISNKY